MIVQIAFERWPRQLRLNSGVRHRSNVAMSNAIALTNMDGKHIGFMLLAGIDDNYRNSTGEWGGDCVFMALPKDPALFSDPAFLELAERKQRGAHSVHVTNDGTTVSFEVADAGTACFYAVIGNDGRSEWGTIRNGTGSKSGRAIFAK